MNGEARYRATCAVHVVDTDTESSGQSKFPCLLGSDVDVAFHVTASSALRAARQAIEGVWFVSNNLRDLPGPQLIEMLGDIPGDKMIVAIGDTYSREDETASLASGACQYFVKPLIAERCRAVIEAYMNWDTSSIPEDRLMENARASIVKCGLF